MSVYALVDPRTNRARYVGRSRNPSRRLYQHLRRGHSEPLRDWVVELRERGLVPQLRILEHASEEVWIRRLDPDLNINIGLRSPKATVYLHPYTRAKLTSMAADEGQSLAQWLSDFIQAKAPALARPRRIWRKGGKS